MKNVKKTICVFLCMMMLVSVFSLPVAFADSEQNQANGTGFLYGDVSENGSVDIEDALIVQKDVAKLIKLEGQSFISADVNGDSVLDIEDSLLIQKMVAKLITQFPVEGSLQNGTTEIIEDEAYTSVQNHHTTIVYTPYGYSENEEYPVIYAHDGQNLFYEDTSAYGHWQLLEILDKLIAEGTIEPVIMVGIYNNESRMYEYSPDDGGDEYMEYIVEQVKPYIDEHYSTKTDAENTAIMGSSMGGLISLYAGMFYSDTFGKAGVMSPSIWYNSRSILSEIGELSELPDTKLWIDAGTGETTGEDDMLGSMVQDARDLTTLLMDKKMKPVDDFMYYEVPNAAHNEGAWAQRVHMALTYFFGTEPVTPVDVDILSSITTNKMGLSLYPIPAVLCENDIIYTPVWEELTLEDNDGVAQLIQPGNRVKSENQGKVTVKYTAFEKTAELKLLFTDDKPVMITFNVTVPEGTPEDAGIYIVGNLLEFGSWEPAFGAKMEKVDATHYTYTCEFEFGTTMAYKYVKGTESWAGVEKDATGGEIKDRAYTVEGTATIEDVVETWAS